MSRIIVRLINGIITLAVSVALIGAGAYAGYALWDNQQIYAAAESTQLEMLRFKPKLVVNEDGEVEAPSFEELLAINPDVCAWITMDNTAIDHPVLQGETNLTYINTNVYKEFALSGSIFLDSRCSRSFKGSYNLLYGHHMDNHGMFGDVSLYKDEQFFRENTTGMLIVPEGVHGLKTLMCIVECCQDDIVGTEKHRCREGFGIHVESYVFKVSILVDEDRVVNCVSLIVHTNGLGVDAVKFLST